MSDGPRDWDRELANIDKAIARQGSSLPPAGPTPGGGSVSPALRPAPPAPSVSRGGIALTCFWVVLGIALAAALLLWLYEKSCGLHSTFSSGWSVPPRCSRSSARSRRGSTGAPSPTPLLRDASSSRAASRGCAGNLPAPGKELALPALPAADHRARLTGAGAHTVAHHTFSRDTMAKTFRNFIGGEWITPQTGAYFENRNPADTGDLIGRFPDSDRRDVDAAVRSARRGFALWSRTPAPERGDVLRHVGDLLVERKEAIADAMTREMGKVLAETRGDVQEGIDTAFYAASEGRRLFGHVVPSELRSKWAMSYRRPIGVVGLITPLNFRSQFPRGRCFPRCSAGTRW